MPQSTHLICRRDDGVNLNGLTKLVEGTNRYPSCCWDLSPEKAASLVGGWIYLHPKKSEPSEFGGVVLGVEATAIGGPSREHRYAIIFEARMEARDQPWRGADHGMAWAGGRVG